MTSNLTLNSDVLRSLTLISLSPGGAAQAFNPWPYFTPEKVNLLTLFRTKTTEIYTLKAKHITTNRPTKHQGRYTVRTLLIFYVLYDPKISGGVTIHGRDLGAIKKQRFFAKTDFFFRLLKQNVYRIYSIKRHGTYLIFIFFGAALIQGQRLFGGGAYLKLQMR